MKHDHDIEFDDRIRNGPEPSTIAVEAVGGPIDGDLIDLAPGEEHYAYVEEGFLIGYAVVGRVLIYAGRLAIPNGIPTFEGGAK